MSGGDVGKAEVDQFVGLTGAAGSIAQQYLARNGGDLERAVDDFYKNEGVQETMEVGKRGLTKPRSMFQSFSDLRKAGEVPTQDSDDPDMNFFTGGEKSGLAVENPDKKKNSRSLVDDLLRKAQEEAGKPDWRDGDDDKNKPKVSAFAGQGHSLGSVEQSVESATVGKSLKNSPAPPEKVTRTITFWKEGFSVDEGKLYKYDDKENQDYLTQLNQGRAPLSLLNVKMFQDVDVNVHKRLEDSYYANQPKKARTFGFEGKGQRLGSPIPGEPIVTEAMVPKEEPKTVQDVGSGDTTIQIRLASGKRIIHKFNSHDPVATIYNFVAELEPASKPWSLALSFPMTLLDDKKEATIADAGLKNAVVIQRWR